MGFINIYPRTGAPFFATLQASATELKLLHGLEQPLPNVFICSFWQLGLGVA